MQRPKSPDLASTALAAALLASAAGSLGALPPDDGSDEWIRVDTAHLVLFSDASRAATIEIGRQMEMYRAVLARLGPNLVADSPLPTWVFVFKNDLAFTPYKLVQRGRHAGMPANLDGFFVQHRDGNYIGVDATPDTSPWPVIYHEYFHFFLHNNFDDIPVWFDEGMAQCYATFRLEGPRALIGGALPASVRWLRSHPLMPLPTLESITFESPAYHEEGTQQTFYAQSWATVDYLLWGPVRRAESGPGFLRDLQRGGSLKDALPTLTALKEPLLEQHVRDYIHKGRFDTSEIRLDTLTWDDTARVTAVARDELLYRLGDFLLRTETERVRNAEEHLREAIRLNPGLAAAHADLGQALVQRGLALEARAEFEKAIALDPKNPVVSLMYAYALIDAAIPPGFTKILPDKGLPPEVARARSMFEVATQASSGQAEAWAGLGSTYLYDNGDLAPGVAALEKAYRLMPTRLDVVHNLAELCARSGRRARAEELVDRVLSRAEDPEVRAAGAGILFRADLDEVGALEDKGDTEAAVQRLRALVAAAPTPDLRSLADKRLRDLETRATQGRAVDQFNAAVGRANAHDYDGAAAILETLAASGADPQVAAQGAALLAQVRDMQTLDRAVALATSGAFDRAADLLRKVARDSKDPKIAAQARDLLPTLEKNRETAAYNQAIDRYNRKDFAGAIALLDRLIADTKDPALADKARNLRGWAKLGLSGSPAPSR